MTDDYTKVTACADAVIAAVGSVPDVAIVLGSGLGDFASALEAPTVVAYRSLPHWPVPQVAGHDGRLVRGRCAGRAVTVLAGRCHAYEGHDLRTVTFPVRVLARLGVRVLLLTNAAGGINPVLTTGSLMLIDDHLNLMGANPLTGPHDDRFGPRFPDMTEVYSTRLRAIATGVAAQLGIGLAHGTYAALAGPSYETPAEVRYLATIGADAVGMSTVPEAIVARQMGLEVLGLSCVTNVAAGLGDAPMAHADVIESARLASGRMSALIGGILAEI